MMKKQNKNFIAFTLSEMMIVIMIISVISAATLPTITARQTDKDAQGGKVTLVQNWKLDNTFTKGYYHRPEQQSEVLIGEDASIIDKAALINILGDVPLRLSRPALHSDVAIDGYSSAIALFDKDNNYSGRIVADGSSIIFDNNQYSAIGGYKKLVIGTYSGAALKSTGGFSTIIGNYAGNTGTISNENNILIGSNNIDVGFSGRVIAIGNYTMAKSNKATKSSDSVAIGAYAAYGTTSISSITVGAYSAYSAEDNSNSINIGAFSGYASKAENVINLGAYVGQSQLASSQTINIGKFSGNNSFSNRTINIGESAGRLISSNASSDNINIGDFAGYSSTGKFHNSINIGKNAGQINNSMVYSVNIGTGTGSYGTNTNSVNIGYNSGYGTINTNSIKIGKYAGYASITNRATTPSNIIFGYTKFANSATVKNMVRIGCYATTELTSAYDLSFCIGGQMPVTTLNGIVAGSSRPIWGSSGGDYTYKMMFVPGGIQAASASSFAKTSIYLYAKRVVAPKATPYTFSDRRLKENIKQTQYGINKLKNLVVYQYNMIDNPDLCIGVIAQELKKYYPNAVGIIPESIRKGGYYSVDAEWIIFSLAQSIKDVDALATLLDKNATTLVSNLKTISKKLDKIDSKISAIKTCQIQNEKKLNEIDKMIAKLERK